MKNKKSKERELFFINLFGTSHEAKHWVDVLKIVVDEISLRNPAFDKTVLRAKKLKNKFAHSEKDARVNSKGYSTQPHKVANSRLWLKLHSDTKSKLKIIKDLFDEFGYEIKDLIIVEKVNWEKMI